MEPTQNDETVPFKTDIPKEEGEPSLTKWRDLFGCPNVFWVVEDDPIPRCKFVRIKFYPSILGICVCAYSFFLWKDTIWPVLTGWSPFWFYFLPFMCFYSILFLLICQLSDPGYLPFNWAQEKKRVFSIEELRNGAAVNDDQFVFAKKSERPPRSCFSVNAGYFILRADHYCGWVNNWIGLKNHRYFMISIISTCIYLSMFVFFVLYTTFKKTNTMTRPKFVFVMMTSVFFLYVIMAQVIFQTFQLSHNYTTLERMKGLPKHYDNGCLESWEEVCGPRKYLPFWCCPIPLKPGVSGFDYEDFSDDAGNQFKCKCQEEENGDSKPLL